MKLSDLNPSDISLVQDAPSESGSLKLSDLKPEEFQLVQDAPQPSTLGKAWNSFKQFTGSMADAGAKAATLGYLNTPEMQANMDKSPTGKIVGTLVGGVPLGIATGAGISTALGPLAEAVGFIPAAARTGANAAAGAGIGFAAKPDDEDSLQARIDNAKFAGTLGAKIGVGAEALSGAANYASGALSDYSADKAAKALGMTKADYKRLGPEAARLLGKQALEQGIVSPLSTPASIETKTDAMKAAAGERIGQIIDNSQATLNQLPPVGMMPAGAPIQATPVEQTVVYGKPQVQRGYEPGAASPISPTMKIGKTQGNTIYLPGDASSISPTLSIGKTDVQTIPVSSFPGPGPADTIEVPVSQLDRGWVKDPATGTQIPVSQLKRGIVPIPDSAPGVDVPVSTATKTIQRAGPTSDFITPIQPRPAGTIDAPALAQKLAANGDAAKLAKVPGMAGLASQINGFLDTLAKNPQDMNLQEAHELRQQIDGAINWGKKRADMAGTQQYLVNIRNALSGAMSDAVDQAAVSSGGQVGALKRANSDYASLARMNDIASNRASMNSANRAVGLTDTIAAGAGGTIGGGIGATVAGPLGAEVGAVGGAAVGGGINKFARTYGPSLQATGANQASKVASTFSGVNNPQVAQAIIQSTMKMKGPDAWAQQGIQNLGIPAPLAQKLFQDPKGKELLIQASNFKPGSKALQQINVQIQKGWGQG